MTTELPESITIAKAILDRVTENALVAGHSLVDDEGRWILQLGLEDSTGERQLELMEGDSFEFAGGTWRVAKVYEPNTRPRGVVAKLERVADSGE